MKARLLILPLLFIIQFAYAQKKSPNPEAYKLYKMESIHLQGNKYVKNGVKYPLGVFATNLAEEMRISDHATLEWNSYVSFRNASLLTSLAGLGLTVAALSVEKNNTRLGLVIGGLGLTIISIPLSVKANNQLHKSVWTHNRDLFQF